MAGTVCGGLSLDGSWSFPALVHGVFWSRSWKFFFRYSCFHPCFIDGWCQSIPCELVCEMSSARSTFFFYLEATPVIVGSSGGGGGGCIL